MIIKQPQVCSLDDSAHKFTPPGFCLWETGVYVSCRVQTNNSSKHGLIYQDSAWPRAIKDLESCISINLTLLLLLGLHVTTWAPVHSVNVDIQLAGQIATLVEISETLLLLLHSRRGGCTQNVLEWGPLGIIFCHKPCFFVFQERCQSLSNVTSRVLVVGLRLGVAEKHIFQVGVFLYPRATRGDRRS